MKKSLLFSLILTLLTGYTIQSQTYVFQARKKGSNDWGFAGLDGKFIIKPKYNMTFDFSEDGAAMVMIGKKYSIINIDGDLMPMGVEKMRPYIDAWSGIADGFRDGYLRITDKKNWGCLGPDGKMVIPIIYEVLTEFNDGLALAEFDNAFYIVDKSGSRKLLEIGEIREVRHFSEGLAAVEMKGQKWGFINTRGEMVIEPQYKTVGYFSGGFAWVRNFHGDIGFVNTDGNMVIPHEYSHANGFDAESGLAKVKKDMHWGYVDSKRNFKRFDEKEDIFSFHEGLAIARQAGKVGFMDNEGNWVIQPVYSSARGFKNGYAAVEKDKLWGIIDKQGNWVVEPRFSNAMDVMIVK